MGTIFINKIYNIKGLQNFSIFASARGDHMATTRNQLVANSVQMPMESFSARKEVFGYIDSIQRDLFIAARANFAKLTVMITSAQN